MPQLLFKFSTSAAVLFNGIKESWPLALKILSQFKLLWFLNVLNTLLAIFHLKIAKKNFLLPAALSNLTRPRLYGSKSKHTGGAKQNLTQNDAIQGHLFWSQWKGDKGLNTNVGLIC